MTKTLLLASFLLGANLTVNAQNTISFEQSEGYALGRLSGQNGWIVTDDGSAEAPNAINVIVSDDLATNAIKFPSTTSDDFSDIHVSKMITPGTNIFSITQKVYAAGRDTDFGSDMKIGTSAMVDGELVLTSGIDFDYQGNIYLLSSYTEGDNVYHFDTDTETSYDADRWYTVKLTFNISANTVEYFVNDVSIGSDELHSGGGVNAVTYVHDALTTVHYVDDITVTAQTAGLNKATATSFSVFPNPATTVINIANNTNANVNSISVTDLNGRIVKANEFNGVTNVQVTIADLSAGVYMLNITSDKGNVTKKIIKN